MRLYQSEINLCLKSGQRWSRTFKGDIQVTVNDSSLIHVVNPGVPGVEMLFVTNFSSSIISSLRFVRDGDLCGFC